MKTSHIYPGMPTLSSYITITNCSEAIAFYIKAINAIEKYRLLLPNGKIGHAEIEIEGSLLMMSDENLDWNSKSPETIGDNPMSFSLYVEDVNKSFQKAIDAGAKMVMPIEDMFYGDRVGHVMDDCNPQRGCFPKRNAATF